MHALCAWWIDKLFVIACFLDRVASFEEHAVNKWLKESFGLFLQGNCGFFENCISDDTAHEADHGVRNLFVSIFLTNFWVKIIRLHVTWKFHGLINETGVGCFVQSHNWEHSLLILVNVLFLMPESLSTSRDSQETILESQKGQGWCSIVLEVSLSRFCDFSLGFEKDTTHQDLTLDIRVLQDIVLRHNSTKRVGSHEDVVSCESSLFKLGNSILNIMIDKNWLWSVEQKLGDSYPSLVSGGSSLLLEFFSQGLVRLWFALHTVDPDESQWLISSCWVKDDSAARNRGCEHEG